MSLQYRGLDNALIHASCPATKGPLLAECCCYPITCPNCDTNYTVTLSVDEELLGGPRTVSTTAPVGCSWYTEWTEVVDSVTWTLRIDFFFAPASGGTPCYWQVNATIRKPYGSNVNIWWQKVRAAECDMAGAYTQWYTSGDNGGTCVVS